MFFTIKVGGKLPFTLEWVFPRKEMCSGVPKWGIKEFSQRRKRTFLKSVSSCMLAPVWSFPGRAFQPWCVSVFLLTGKCRLKHRHVWWNCTGFIYREQGLRKQGYELCKGCVALAGSVFMVDIWFSSVMNPHSATQRVGLGLQLIRKPRLLQSPMEKEQEWRRGHRRCSKATFPLIHGPEEAENDLWLLSQIPCVRPTSN